MLRLRLVALLISALAGSVSLAGQDAAATDRFQQLEDWLDAVDTHHPGDVDSAIITITDYSAAELERVAIDAQTLLSIAANPRVTMFTAVGASGFRRRIGYSRADMRVLRQLASRFDRPDSANAFARRAAVLHADALLLTDTVQETSTIPRGVPSGFVLEMADGEHLADRHMVPHLAFARALLDLIKPSPSKDETVRLWYQATLASLHGSERYEMVHIERAVQLFPDDGEILLQAGTLHETLAGPKVQRAIRGVRLPMGVTLAIGNPGYELGRAQTFLERAVRAKPDLVEARIRLGRVRLLRGDARAAIAELVRARSETKNRFLLYYDALFLGAAEEAVGDLPNAREAYRRAAALYSTAQSPKLALSRIDTLEGREQGALDGVTSAVRVPPDAERVDPWWDYHVASGRTAPALMDALYKRVMSPSE